MNWNLLIYLVSPYLGIVLMFFFSGQVVPLRTGYRSMMLWLLPMLLINVVKQLWGSASLVGQIDTLVSSLLVLFVYPLLLLDGPKWKRITHTAIFHVMQLLADVVAYAVFTPSYGADVNAWSFVQTAIYFFVTWSVYIAACSVCVLLARSITSHRFQVFYLLYLMVPVSQIIILYFGINRMHNGAWLLGVLLGVGAMLLLLSYTIDHERGAELEKELRELRHAEELERLHYQSLMERQEELAHIRHDFNNSLAVITQMVHSEEWGDASKMVQSLEEKVNATKEDLHHG